MTDRQKDIATVVGAIATVLALAATWFFAGQTVFLISLGVMTVGIVAMLIYLQFLYEPKPINVDEILEYPLERHPLIFPCMLHCHGFDEYWNDRLQDAINIWYKATDKRIIFGCQIFEAKQRFDLDTARDGHPSIWVMKKDDPALVRLLTQYSMVAGGYCVGNVIVIVDEEDEDQTEEYHTTVLLHELGHLLGMEHIKPKYPALMNLGANKGQITKYDLAVLDSIYKPYQV